MSATGIRETGRPSGVLDFLGHRDRLSKGRVPPATGQAGETLADPKHMDAEEVGGTWNCSSVHCTMHAGWLDQAGLFFAG